MKQGAIKLLYPVGISVIILLISGLMGLMHQQIISVFPTGFSAFIAVLVGGPILLNILSQRLQNSKGDYYSGDIDN